MTKQKLETCFSPALFEPENHKDSIVVIIDVLRASSAICAAFLNGAAQLIPVAEVEEAREYKSRGYLVAAERDGYVLDFADFGNSPFNFTPDRVAGKTIVYSTTNGTALLKLSSSSFMTVIGSFNNFTSLGEMLVESGKDILLFCAAWKNRFNLEDTVCAGAFADTLLKSGKYETIDDSTRAATDLWTLASADPLAYIEKAAQRSRLRNKQLDDCIPYCMTKDMAPVIPVMKNGVLVKL
jgi:2-phosphosulfolactate phosphatase